MNYFGDKGEETLFWLKAIFGEKTIKEKSLEMMARQGAELEGAAEALEDDYNQL